MRLLVQRVLEAAVTVDGQTTGAIGKGLLVMTGFGDEDGPDFHHSPVFEGMARKLLDLRIFPGEGDRCDKFDRSARDSGAGVLLVPQFTLYADCRKGRRPSFSHAGLVPRDVRPLHPKSQRGKRPPRAYGRIRRGHARPPRQLGPRDHLAGLPRGAAASVPLRRQGVSLFLA